MNKRQKLVQEKFLNNEEAVIKRLKGVYGQSLKDITGKISDLDKSIGALQKALADVDDDEIGDLAKAFLGRRANISPAEAKETLQSMIQSKVYQKRYQEALKGQIDGIMDKMHGKEYKVVSDYLEECYEDGFIGTMFDLQGQGIPLCFPLDQEAMVRAVQLDSKISQGLYSRLGEDVALLKKKITAQVSRGIATGMSYQQVARGLANYTNIGYNNAIRIARTEGHRIQVQGTMDACYKAKKKGADVVKQWDSTLDGRTRESHAQVDGEIRELDKRFSNGLMFPGDPSGRAEEVINCRCALLQRARWALDESELETLQKRAEYFGLDKSETFEEYKKTYLKAAEQANAKYSESKFAPANTMAEINSRAQKATGAVVNLQGIDIDDANEYLRAFEYMADEYPAINGFLQQIDTKVPFGLGGAYQIEPKIAKDGHYSPMTRIGMSKTITAKDVLHQIERGEFFDGQDRYTMAIHEASHAVASLMSCANSGLYKDGKWIKTDAGRVSASVYRSTKFSQSITDRARSELYGDDLQQYFVDISILGGYAQHSDDEMIAQCIAYELSGRSSPFSQKVKEIFDKEYKRLFG